nr:MAG TPA: hypothetical protein [Bacteriophage sp.]
MTESEAVEKLEAHIECESKRSKIEGCNDGCPDCELAYLQGTSKEHIESVKLAIQALEKQIPTKVQLRHIRKFDGFDDGECPTCGLNVSRDCDGTDVFCPDCGQKLDWGGSVE